MTHFGIIAASNRAPIVTLPASVKVEEQRTIPLVPRVSDDGLPKPSKLYYKWQVKAKSSPKVSFAFSNSTTKNPDAHCGSAGWVDVRLVVSDGVLSQHDDMRINIVPSNRPPVLQMETHPSPFVWQMIWDEESYRWSVAGYLAGNAWAQEDDRPALSIINLSGPIPPAVSVGYLGFNNVSARFEFNYPGIYRFKIVATDSKGLIDSATYQVFAIREPSYYLTVEDRSVGRVLSNTNPIKRVFYVVETFTRSSGTRRSSGALDPNGGLTILGDPTDIVKVDILSANY